MIRAALQGSNQYYEQDPAEFKVTEDMGKTLGDGKGETDRYVLVLKKFFNMCKVLQ